MSTVIDNSSVHSCAASPTFEAGDRVQVHFQVIEGTRRRTQVFEGVVIKRQGHGARETFTVRKQSFGVGVERTFPLHSPKIERIDVAARGDVRRAKLYYLRQRVGKRARVRERRSVGPEEVVERELLHAPVDEEAQAPADAELSPPEAGAERPRPRRPRPRSPRPPRLRPPHPWLPRSPLPTGMSLPLHRRRRRTPSRRPQSPPPAKRRCDAGQEVGS